jgi:DNA-binding NtrC family response regulator
MNMIRRVLIVESDPKIADDMFSLFHSEYGRFERERYEPEIAESFTDAIEQAQTVNFHCIIMDADLPEMTGYEAVPIMKKISKNTPIIITTDKNTLERETKAREQNVYYYHVRPSNLDGLKLAISSIFEKLKRTTDGKETDEVAAKPIMLKQLRLFREKRLE